MEYLAQRQKGLDEALAKVAEFEAIEPRTAKQEQQLASWRRSVVGFQTPLSEADTLNLAKQEAIWKLNETDYVEFRRDIGRELSPDWLAWRANLRAVVRGEATLIQSEPARYV